MEQIIEELRNLSQQIDDHYARGEAEQGEALLRKAIHQSKDVPGYRHFFLGELAGYLEENLEEQEQLFTKALLEQSDDSFLLQQKGINLSELGRDEEAIELYDRALAINPNDHNAIRQKGVALSKLGRYKEAIKLFDRAIEMNQKDHHAFREKGVALSKLGRDNEAIIFFDRAIAMNPKDNYAIRESGISLSKLGRNEKAIILFDRALGFNPKDHRAFREKGIAFSKLNMLEEAIELLKRAYRIEPDHTTYRWLQYIASKTERSVEEILAGTPGDEERLRPGLESILGMVERVQAKFKDHIDDFVTKMNLSKERLQDFLSTESLLFQERSFLLVQRKWNSFTPVVPSLDEQRSVGGGYFIYHNHHGTVIDPGYNFIESFCKAKGRITDIDSIVLTHAHNDHTADFESLMTLLFEYNEHHNCRPGDYRYKRVKVYLNTGSLMKFSGLIDLRGCPYFDRIYTMSPGNRYTLDGGLELTVLPAYHDELVTKDYAVGLQICAETEKGTRRLLFTSDTGLYPSIKRGGNTVANSLGKEIHDLYDEIGDGTLKKNVDLLVAHIGSIKADEIRQKPQENLEGVFYPNHLGVVGTCQVISAIHPRLAVVSEFGEELRVFRPKLLELIDEVVKGFFKQIKGKKATRVVPGDLPFVYDLADRSVYCYYSEKMVPDERICFVHEEETFYYFDESCSETVKKDARPARRYETRLEENRLPYLRSWTE